MNKMIQRKPDPDWLKISTIEMHTCGEPLRIITSGLPELKGSTIIEKSKYFQEHFDHIRTGLIWEPRGHADMYGAVLTDPVTQDGDAGVFFLHNEGYSTMCGHAVIALTRLFSESGYGEKTGNERTIRMDVPAGRVTGKAIYRNEKIVKLSFENVPSFVLMDEKEVVTNNLGKVKFDIAFGGAFYAFVDSVMLGINLQPVNYHEIIEKGREIKNSISRSFDIIHPFQDELGFLYGTIFTGEPVYEDHHSRNVCIFAEGELDRSPTGTGVSARAALHYSKGELLKDQSITIESILDTTMEVKIKEVLTYGSCQAIIPEVSGQSYYTGSSEFIFDPDDPLKEGFIFR